MNTGIRFIACAALGVLFFAIPTVTHALVISEISYDPSGADTGREWVELHNPSSESVTITGGTGNGSWRFFDGSAKRVIVGLPDETHGGRGSMTIPAGGYIVLANSPTAFYVDYPNGNYTVLRSALSLNNTGTRLGLFDGAGVEIDSVSYTKEDGAAGDGMTLHRVDGVLTAGSPTPGAGFLASTPSSEDSSDNSFTPDDTDDTSVGVSTNDSASVVEVHPLTNKKTTTKLSLSVGVFAVAGQPIALEGIFQKNELFVRSGRFEWTLGDGTGFTTRKLEKFHHVYQYSGTYVVVLEYYANEFDDVPYLRVIKKVSVLAGSIAITSVDDRGAITLHNNEKKDIHLEGWTLQNGTERFVFRKNTLLLASGELTIPRLVHGFMNPAQGTILLRRPDGTDVAQYPLPASRSLENTMLVDESVDTAYSTDENSIQTERARIVDSDQQRSGIPQLQMSSQLLWILLGLVGILVCVAVVCIRIMIPRSDVFAAASCTEQRHKRFDDDITLLR